MAMDLTEGKPDRVLWRYSLPLFGSIVFQQLYNIADSFVAGKFVGEQALAAVGNSSEVTLIYLSFAVGLNIRRAPHRADENGGQHGLLFVPGGLRGADDPGIFVFPGAYPCHPDPAGDL